MVVEKRGQQYTVAPPSLMVTGKGDLSFKDLQREGYSYGFVDEKDEVLNTTRRTIEISKGGKQVKDARITFLVVDECKTVVIENFYPQFPKERKGRGRALLGDILGQDEFSGYEVIGVAADVGKRGGKPLLKSFAKMTELNPVVDDKQGSVWDHVGKERVEEFKTNPDMIKLQQQKPQLAEKMQELWFDSNIYGKIPEKKKV